MKWNLSLTQKLYALILIPVFCFLVFAGFEIHSKYTLYVDGTNMDMNVNFYEHVVDLTHEIQKERGLSSLFLGNKISQTDMDEQRKKVDAQVFLYKGSYSTFLQGSSLPEKAQTAILFLDKVRQNVQQKTAAADVIKSFFWNIICQSNFRNNFFPVIINCFFGSVLYMLRSVKVWFTKAEVNHINPLCSQFSAQFGHL